MESNTPSKKIKLMEKVSKLDQHAIDVSDKDAETIAQQIPTKATTTLKVCFNKNKVVDVDREKMLKLSDYFTSITKTCYRDHKSNVVEVNFHSSFDTFKQVMDFVDTGNINLDDKSVYDICELGQYLQIDSLQKPCLDYFTYNLNSITVETQLNLLQNHYFLDGEFTERALKFKESGRPSFSGLYFLERCDLFSNSVVSLNVVSSDFSHVHKISDIEFHGQGRFCEVEYFNNSIIFVCKSFESQYLYQYDLTIGIMNKISLKLKDRVNVCCNNKNFFTVNVTKNEKSKNFISLSVYGKLGKTQKLSLSKKITFDPSFEDVEDAEIFTHANLRLLFIHCNDNRVYVFYCGDEETTDVRLDKMLLMTICLKTFSTIKLEWVKNLITNYCKLLTESPLVNHLSFCKKMFWLKDEQKLFIRMNLYNTKSLVFDTKKHAFYFNTNINPHCYEGIYSANGNTLYEILVKEDTEKFHNLQGCLYTFDCKSPEEESITSWIEVKSYEYKTGKFVDEKMMLKTVKKVEKQRSIRAATFV